MVMMVMMNSTLVSSGLLTSVFMAAMKDSTEASIAAASTSIASDRRAAFNTAARLYNYIHQQKFLFEPLICSSRHEAALRGSQK